jgi:hypothetical protein
MNGPWLNLCIDVRQLIAAVESSDRSIQCYKDDVFLVTELPIVMTAGCIYSLTAWCQGTISGMIISVASYKGGCGKPTTSIGSEEAE